MLRVMTYHDFIMRKRGSHGWGEISADDKRAVIDAIVSGSAPKGPLHLELDISDRCNVDCYFCNAMDVRTKENVPYERVTQILDEAVATGLRSVRFAGGSGARGAFLRAAMGEPRGVARCRRGAPNR